MLYYTIYKGDELVGIGSTKSDKLPTNTKMFTFKKCTYKQYLKLDQRDFSGLISKH